MGEPPPKIRVPIQSVTSAVLNPKHVAAASLYGTKMEVTVQVTNLRTCKFSPSLLRVLAEAATALAPPAAEAEMNVRQQVLLNNVVLVMSKY